MSGKIAQFRQIDRLDDIPASEWDRVFDPAYPFCRHAWLAALERHGCVRAELGWEPCHLIGEDDRGNLVAAAPLYLKQHSYGEFVFDFAWADACHRAGRAYYPKLVNAVPFVPSIGPRMGATDPETLAATARELDELCANRNLVSLHSLFPDQASGDVLADRGMLERHDVQFHWYNPGYADFSAFVAELSSAKRKKLLRERRRVEESGIKFTHRPASDLTASDWDHVHALYSHTYFERGMPPYFTREFLEDVGNSPDLDLQLVEAWHEDRRVAVAITLVGGDTLYGRHWGAEAHYHSLHFECCYYQGIELCLARGLKRFDAGTQGEHKLARGFVPVRTRSFHRIEWPPLSEAVSQFLERERSFVAARLQDLVQHSPYRADSGVMQAFLDQS